MALRDTLHTAGLGPFWHWTGGTGAVVGLVLGVLAWAAWARRLELVVLAGLAVALTDPLCARLLKPMFGRDRPCRTDLPEVPDCGAGLSMPSNHAANLAAITMATGSIPLGFLALIGGTARVVNGQHYPSDVVVGWIVGGIVGGAVRFGARRRLAPEPMGRRTPEQTWK